MYVIFMKLFSVLMVVRHTFLTSMKELSVLSVGLCVMRNLMFLWHSSTGAGRFMVTSVTLDVLGWTTSDLLMSGRDVMIITKTLNMISNISLTPIGLFHGRHVDMSQ